MWSSASASFCVPYSSSVRCVNPAFERMCFAKVIGHGRAALSGSYRAAAPARSLATSSASSASARRTETKSMNCSLSGHQGCWRSPSAFASAGPTTKYSQCPVSLARLSTRPRTCR